MMKSNFVIVAIALLMMLGCDKNEPTSSQKAINETLEVKQELPNRLSIVSQDISVNRYNSAKVVKDSETGLEFIVFTNSDGTFALPLTETNKKDLEIDLESER